MTTNAEGPHILPIPASAAPFCVGSLFFAITFAARKVKDMAGRDVEALPRLQDEIIAAIKEGTTTADDLEMEQAGKTFAMGLVRAAIAIAASDEPLGRRDKDGKVGR